MNGCVDANVKYNYIFEIHKVVANLIFGECPIEFMLHTHSNSLETWNLIWVNIWRNALGVMMTLWAWDHYVYKTKIRVYLKKKITDLQSSLKISIMLIKYIKIIEFDSVHIQNRHQKCGRWKWNKKKKRKARKKNTNLIALAYINCVARAYTSTHTYILAQALARTLYAKASKSMLSIVQWATKYGVFISIIFGYCCFCYTFSTYVR